MNEKKNEKEEEEERITNKTTMWVTGQQKHTYMRLDKQTNNQYLFL